MPIYASITYGYFGEGYFFLSLKVIWINASISNIYSSVFVAVKIIICLELMQIMVHVGSWKKEFMQDKCKPKTPWYLTWTDLKEGLTYRNSFFFLKVYFFLWWPIIMFSALWDLFEKPQSSFFAKMISLLSIGKLHWLIDWLNDWLIDWNYKSALLQRWFLFFPLVNFFVDWFIKKDIFIYMMF